MNENLISALGFLLMFVSLLMYCACRVGDIQDDDDIQEEALRKSEEEKRKKQKRKKRE